MLILGPCAAESREQVLLTASQIKDACGERPFIYRAGAWKPRTSPHTFQGVGEEALAWLAEAKALYGVETATEVATPEHVTKAIEAGIDYLWIGARTSASPMAVSAIAEAIADRLRLIEYRPAAPDRVQTDFPLKGVLIKNPVNEDAGLWIGNIERLEKTGVPVIAVHRGCGHRPCWAMAHKVRTERPGIPLLLDPSHLSGEAAKVPELLKMIPELGLDGAMIEVHCSPAEALSDAKQQVTPSALAEIKHASERVSSPNPTEKGVERREETELNWLRAEIDELDETLWNTIAARMDVSKRIGEWKKANGVAPLQPERYQQIINKLKIKNYELRMKTGKQSFREEFMMKVWELIHEESLRMQS